MNSPLEAQKAHNTSNGQQIVFGKLSNCHSINIVETDYPLGLKTFYFDFGTIKLPSEYSQCFFLKVEKST